MPEIDEMDGPLVIKSSLAGTSTQIIGADGDAASAGGPVDIIGGGATDPGHAGGGISLTGGVALADGQNGGNITIWAGEADNAGGTGGNVYIDAGGGSTNGNILLGLNIALPTADPAVAGALWIDTGAGRVLKVSAG